MAIYHCSAQVISRGRGRSAVAAAAYRSGSVIKNEYDGIVHDYTRKKGVVYAEVMLPENAPEKYRDRATLWNEVELSERSNAQLAQEYECSIPKELPADQWVDFARRLVNDLLVKYGRIADFAIHARETDGTPNPHIHITCPMRPLGIDGKWEAKTQQLYLCKNAAGEKRAFTNDELAQPCNSGWQKQHKYSKGGDPKAKKIYLTEREAAGDPRYKGYERVKGERQPKTEKYGRKNPTMEYWGSKDFLLLVREGIADHINAELERLGLDERVDHRSLKDRGIDREATIHEGVAARAIERNGGTSERCEINREIKKSAKKTSAIEAEIAALAAEINAIRTENRWLDMYARIDHVERRVGENLWAYDALQDQLKRLDVLEGEVMSIGSKTQGVIDPDVAYERYQLALAQIGALRTEIDLQVNTMRNLERTHIILHYGEAAYGAIDVQDINEDYRIVEKDDQYTIVERSAGEKALVRDVKRADIELTGMYDTYLLKKLIEENRAAAKQKEPAKKREDILIRSIEENFENLRFIERTGVCNIAAAKEALSKLYSQKVACQDAIAQVESMVALLQMSDAAAAGEYVDRIKRLQEQLVSISGEIAEYQRCVDVLSRYSRGYSFMDIPADAKVPQQFHVEPVRTAELERLAKAKPQAPAELACVGQEKGSQIAERLQADADPNRTAAIEDQRMPVQRGGQMTSGAWDDAMRVAREANRAGEDPSRENPIKNKSPGHER